MPHNETPRAKRAWWNDDDTEMGITSRRAKDVQLPGRGPKDSRLTSPIEGLRKAGELLERMGSKAKGMDSPAHEKQTQKGMSILSGMKGKGK